MGVFCLYIRVKLKPEMVAEFKERFAVLANHVRENEPETVSYQLCESDQSPDEFMIVERYPSRASWRTCTSRAPRSRRSRSGG